MRTFIENYLHFMKNCIRPLYEKLKPLKSGFIENMNFENNRDPYVVNVVMVIMINMDIMVVIVMIIMVIRVIMVIETDRTVRTHGTGSRETS